MSEPDFYKVLEVSRQSSADEIKKSYRKLARKYHPDMCPNDKQASEKFKEIQEAYAVLGDADKRKMYDEFGANFSNSGSGKGGRGPRQTYTWSGPGGGGPIDLEDIFGHGNVGDATEGFDFSSIFGGGGGAKRRSSRRETRRPDRGADVRTEIEIPLLVAAQGGMQDIKVHRSSGVERLSVKIRKGVTTGQVIRLTGQGEPGGIGGGPGDLLLTVRIAPHPYFRVEKANVLLDLPISPAEATLGAKVDVPTLTEGDFTLTIPPGTSSGTKLRLRSKGLIDPETGQQGDQYCVIKIVVPKTTSDALRDLYRKVSELKEDQPRAGLW
ncbi:MAG: DnaJ domain-containing protein [Planctomycetota bacterium]|nr:DnaJ domain-containing protein [Planctomycetota bacterium]